MHLLILMTTTYFIGALVFCRQVTRCICKKTLKKFNFMTMDCIKQGRERNIQYKVASSSICLKTVQDFSEGGTLLSARTSSQQTLLVVLFGNEGLNVNQKSNAVTGRAVNFCLVGQNLQASSMCTALPRAHERQTTTATWDHAGVSDGEKL